MVHWSTHDTLQPGAHTRSVLNKLVTEHATLMSIIDFALLSSVHHCMPVFAHAACVADSSIAVPNYMVSRTCMS